MLWSTKVEPKKFKQNLPNVKAQALVDALADSIAEVEAEKLTNTR